MIKNEKYYKIQNLKFKIELNLIMLEFLYETPVDYEEYDDLVFEQEKKVDTLLNQYIDYINNQ